MFNQYHIIMTEVTNAPKNNLKFADVYNEFRPLIATFLRTKIKSEQAQEEIICDVFIKVHEHLAVYNPEKAKLNTWIYTIVNRKVIDFYRSDESKRAEHFVNKSDFVNSEGEEAFEFVGNSDASEPMQNTELRNKINKAIRGLKPTERQIAIMRFIIEYEYAEIAEILDIPLNSVKVMIMRAKESLQNALKSEYAMLG